VYEPVYFTDRRVCVDYAPVRPRSLKGLNVVTFLTDVEHRRSAQRSMPCSSQYTKAGSLSRSLSIVSDFRSYSSTPRLLSASTSLSSSSLAQHPPSFSLYPVCLLSEAPCRRGSDAGRHTGVIKDILLVVGSVVIMGSTVTFAQIVGYGIALAGLVVFKTPQVRLLRLPCLIFTDPETRSKYVGSH
jgi:hypothetical protein